MPRVSTPEDLQAIVPNDLADLIPAFLKNRNDELKMLREALAAGDFGKLLHVSNRMRGVGGSYGFPEISTLGARIEASVRSKDTKSLRDLIARYRDYLANVTIKYGPRS